MGICNSCFGGGGSGSGSKYLGRSPDNTFLDSDDAQKLLPKPIVKKPAAVPPATSADQVKGFIDCRNSQLDNILEIHYVISNIIIA